MSPAASLARAKETAQLLAELAHSRNRPVPELARRTLEAVDGEPLPDEIIEKIDFGRSDVALNAPDHGPVIDLAPHQAPDLDQVELEIDYLDSGM